MNSATTTAAVVLWHRPPGKRQRWTRVGTFPTRRAALAAVQGAGDWYTAPAGQSPTDKPPPRN